MWGPIQSAKKITSASISLFSSGINLANESSSLFPLGLPICDARIHDPPDDNTCLIVGNEATILELSLISPNSLIGTLKSVLIKTFFPEKEISLIDFMNIRYVSNIILYLCFQSN